MHIFAILIIASFILFLYMINRFVLYPSMRAHKYTMISPIPKLNRTLNIAHRGGALEAPESSMIAFQKAVQKDNIDILEIDVQRSRDNQAIVFHDKTLSRTTNGNGYTWEHRLDELKQFDIAYYFSPDGGKSYPERGNAHSIISLDELFSAFPDTIINIDIKEPSPTLVKEVFRLVKSHLRMDKTILGSSSSKTWKYIKQEQATIDPCHLYFPPSEVFRLWLYHILYLTPLFKTKYCAIEIPRRFLFMNLYNKRLVKECKAMNITLFYWTVNEPGLMNDMLNQKVDGIVTDLPGLLAGLIKDRDNSD